MKRSVLFFSFTISCLADEPAGNLDSNSTESIYKLLRNINTDTGTTFIIITHDSRIAEKADRIVEIKDGRIGLDLQNEFQQCLISNGSWFST